MKWLDHFCFLEKVDDSKSHSELQKNTIVGMITLSAFTAPFSSYALFPSLDALVDQFHTTTTKVALTTTVFVLGLAIGPLWWSSLSQEYGRRPILVLSFVLSGVAVIVCSVSNSLPLITGFRFLEAVGSSSAQSVGAGVISDIYIPTERGTALSWFWLGTLAGSIVAPIIGGGLQEWLGWQANLYCSAILTFSAAILTLVFVPETLVKITSTAKTEHISDTKSLWTRVMRDAGAPLQGLKYFMVPSILFCMLYVSICFAILYCLTTSLPYAYSGPPYNFSAIEVGLCYISNCLGYAIGTFVGGRLSDYKLRQYQATNDGKTDPLVRLSIVWYGVPFMPVGLILYGWLIEAKTYWVIPLVGMFLFSLGLMLATSTMTPYLVDIVPGAGASIVADLNLMRNILAAVGIVVSPVAVENIGFGWLMTILAILCALGTGFVGIVVWRGATWKGKETHEEIV
jgi:MFS family permease